MAMNKEKFVKLFLTETEDNIAQCEKTFLVLKDDPENADARKEASRLLHTMKGSARMLQYTAFENAVHAFESIMKSVADGRISFDAKISRFSLVFIDILKTSLSSIESGGPDDDEKLPILLEACKKLGANESFDLSQFNAGSTGSKADTARELSGSISHANQILKVEVESIDAAINSINTLSTRQIHFATVLERIRSLEKRIRSIQSEETDLKAIRRQLSSLSREVKLFHSQYSEKLIEIDYGIQELRNNILGMRMLPVASVIDPLHRMTADLSEQLGKKVNLSISGQTVRADRNIIQLISDPLLHIIRNAIDHGIETPDERKKKGKDECGSISISCRQEGKKINIEILDDGRGLDFEKIRQTAKKLWPDDGSDYQSFTDTELSRLIFKTGFSTQASVSKISGRGLGLDIVKANLDQIKGAVTVDSPAGSGTRFTLSFPVTSSVVDGLIVTTNRQDFFIPASSIKQTLLFDISKKIQVMQKDMIPFEGVNFPLYELSTLLQMPPIKRKETIVPVILIKGPYEVIAIIVDKIHSYSSTVFQDLPESLRNNDYLYGITFDPNYHIIPILNMHILAESTRSIHIMDIHERHDQESSSRKDSILVVDDSHSTLEIELAILESEGYEAIGAHDGIDAMQKLFLRQYSLIITDIDMPRMNGKQLIENIRMKTEYVQTPIIIITGLAQIDLPASITQSPFVTIIQKSGFTQDNLVETVRQKISAKAGI